MGKTVCIIDTNQFIYCPEVLEYAVGEGYATYIPEAVFSEIKKVLYDNLSDDKIIAKVRQAKLLTEQYKGKYTRVKALVNASIFADPKILQCLLDFITDKTVEKIIVYTADGPLARDIINKIGTLESIKRSCSITVIDFEKNRPQRRTSVSQPGEKEYIHSPKAKVLRSGKYLSGNDSSAPDVQIHKLSATTANAKLRENSGHSYEIIGIFVENNDTVIIYRNLPVSKGDRISIKFMNASAQYDVKIGLKLYSQQTRKTQYLQYTDVKETAKWNTISIVADDNYETVNFCILAKSSSGEDDFDLFGYIDEFTITHS